MTYRIHRFFLDDDLPREVIITGLTLEQAQAHCRNPESNSRTATSVHAQRRTQVKGEWFDGYTEDPRARP